MSLPEDTLEIIKLYTKKEYSFNAIGDFIPSLTLYPLEDGEIHPAMLVVPGGAYAFVSPSEASIIAKKFNTLGYNAFVLSYTVNLDGAFPPIKKQPLEDLSRAMRLLRSKHNEFHIDPNKIAVVGFSAGGHLVGSLAVHADEDGMPFGISAKPNAAILSYPVITSGEFCHQGSIDNLLGKDASAEELAWASLETQVNGNTCPCFLWHTMEDTLVPPENSILFADALKKAGILHELHLFAAGHHGQSLATEEWKAGNYEYRDVLSQYISAIKYEIANRKGEYSSAHFDIRKVDDPEEAIRALLLAFLPGADSQVNPSLQIWPELADKFCRIAFDRK